MRAGQGPLQHPELDDVDRQVISLLQENGRRSNANMARVIGTSVQTVKNRIDRLVGAGVMDVTAIMDPSSIGLGKNAIICMRVRQGHESEVVERLAKLDSVSYVAYLAGSFSIMIQVFLENDEHLFHFLIEELAQIKEIEANEVWTVLHERKSNYAWARPLGSFLAARELSNRPKNSGVTPDRR